MLPAARVVDLHVCPMVTGVVPHVGGPILPPGFPTVLIGGMPAARATDLAFCVGPPDVIAKGSNSVLIGNLLAARMTDSTVHGGMIAMGYPLVLIGTAAGGGGGLPANAVGMINGMLVVRQPDGTLKVGQGIVIDGDPAFQSQTLAALGEIANTPTGAGLLASIDSSGHTTTIRETAGGNGAGPVTGADAVPAADGTPGPGTDTNVSYNPDRNQIGDGSEPWHTRPPAVGLAHELMHANHNAQGTNDFTPTGEDMVVGNPPHDTQPFTENAIRSEWNPPQPNRDTY